MKRLRRWLTLTVAVGFGAAEGLIGPLLDLYDTLFTSRGLEALSWVTMLPAVMYASVSFVWWGLVRRLHGLRRWGPAAAANFLAHSGNQRQ